MTGCVCNRRHQHDINTRHTLYPHTRTRFSLQHVRNIECAFFMDVLYKKKSILFFLVPPSLAWRTSNSLSWGNCWSQQKATKTTPAKNNINLFISILFFCMWEGVVQKCEECQGKKTCKAFHLSSCQKDSNIS